MKKNNDWTVMIYLAGDNNLSVDMAYTLEELRKKSLNNAIENINLYVFYENSNPAIPSLFGDFSDPQSPVYHWPENLNGNNNGSGSDYPLVEFVNWCHKRDAQADEAGRNLTDYALIFSGHTMGFLSRGLLPNETPGREMSLPGLNRALEVITTDILGQKLAILGFDSCVMSMLEVGHQFKNVAATMIASEGSIPNAGWSYAEILNLLGESVHRKDLNDLAGEFVRTYIENQSAYSIGGVAVDMAAWDLGKVDGLTEKFGDLAANLLACFRNKSSSVYRQMKRVLLQTHWNTQSYMFDQNVDLGDFCSLLQAELDCLKTDLGGKLPAPAAAVFESCGAVLTELEKCIILSGFSGGSYQFSTGISLFFPWSLSGYEVAQKDYQQLNFIKETKAGCDWNRFLEKYLGQVSRRMAQQPARKQWGILKPGPAHPPLSQAHRIPFDPLTRIPFDPLTRIPFDPLTKMTGSSQRFFENLARFKNIETKWDVTGYTRD